RAVPSAFAGFKLCLFAGLPVPAVWHWSEAVQTTELLPVHTPLSQVSVWVHALPSLQAVPSAFAGFEHVPLAGSQVPAMWHWSEAVQTTALMPVHTPLSQVSVWVQALPSLQAVPSSFAGFEQVPLAGSQVPASWHWSGAAQTTGLLPVHTPLSQVSVWVQASPSLQAVPSGWRRSSGQVALVPVQFSAASHSSTAGRHSVLADLKVSAGQSSLEPSQVSATSQTPAAARHSVPAGSLASAGQAGPLPVQNSAGSQAPAEPRHSVPAATKASAGQSFVTPLQLSATSQAPSAGRHIAVLFASAGQSGPLPVQLSATSQTPAAGRHTVSAAAKASAGQSSLGPSQVSATSQSPAAARHSVPAGRLASAGQSVLVPVQVSATSQAPAAARHSVPAWPAGC